MIHIHANDIHVYTKDTITQSNKWYTSFISDILRERERERDNVCVYVRVGTNLHESVSNNQPLLTPWLGVETYPKPRAYTLGFLPLGFQSYDV